MGCGTCAGCCPAKAVTMGYARKNRTFVPTINKHACKQCGICLAVCPGHKCGITGPAEQANNHSGIGPVAVGKYIKCYIGHAADANQRMAATSGGIVPAITSYLLEEKIVEAVVASTMDEQFPFLAKSMMCTTKEDLLRTGGSKYCPVAVNSIIADPGIAAIKSMAWIGLPCHIQGLCKARKYAPLKMVPSIISIGLLCGGSRGQEATKWVLKSRKLPVADVGKIRYRGNGWPGSMKVEFKSGLESPEIPYGKYKDICFDSWEPWRCSLCAERTSQMADISVGDAWLKELLVHKEGFSLIVTRSEKGENLIRAAAEKGVIKIIEKDFETITRAQKGLVQDISSMVLPAIRFAGKFRKRVPEYASPGDHDSMAGFVPVAGNVRHAMKRLVIMGMYRRMTLSPALYFFIRSIAIFFKSVILSNEARFPKES
jgi:coenzyme F420 hydrogenase subunit beta